MKTSTDDARSSSAPEPKRPYRRPTLLRYGDIRKLTETGNDSGPSMDGFLMLQKT